MALFTNTSKFGFGIPNGMLQGAGGSPMMSMPGATDAAAYQPSPLDASQSPLTSFATTAPTAQASSPVLQQAQRYDKNRLFGPLGAGAKL